MNLGMPLINNLGKYLGMPMVYGKVNQNTCKFIFDKVFYLLVGWKAKYLCLAKRVTLIKSITSTIPVYAI